MHNFYAFSRVIHNPCKKTKKTNNAFIFANNYVIFEISRAYSLFFKGFRPPQFRTPKIRASVKFRALQKAEPAPSKQHRNQFHQRIVVV